MAAKTLLPGHGGKYTSIAVGSESVVATEDTFDMSLCSAFALQTNTTAGVTAGTLQVEQTINGSDWASLGSTHNVATDGAITRFDATDGPFNTIRVNPVGITAGSLTYTIIGDPKYPF